MRALSRDDLTAWLATQTVTLCAIPSVTRDEARLADYLMHRIPELSPGTIPIRHGNNVLVRCGTPGGPRIGLFGHTDTVPPTTDSAPCIDLDRRCVVGLGASDMKAGLAVMLRLVAESAALPVDLTCVFYDREEGPADQNGLLLLCEQERDRLLQLDLCLVLEPTANRIEAGCSGSLHAQVAVHGKRAHSARPWLGQNALYAARPLLDKLAAATPQPVVVDGLVFHEVVSATQIATRNARNVIPDQVDLNLNVRFAPNRSVEDARQWLLDFVGGLGTVEFVDAAPAGTVCTSHPWLSAFIKEHGLTVTAKQAWTDVARLTALGLPAVNLGPGDPEEAHRIGETCPLDTLAENHRLLRLLFARIASLPKPTP